MKSSSFGPSDLPVVVGTGAIGRLSCVDHRDMALYANSTVPLAYNSHYDY
jgi:hypothetical protein